MLKFSIITINYNNDEGLKKTIQSVTKQTYSSIQYIIIDGGSTDTSVDVIKEYESQISYWVSEHDKGVYHAMNKGIVNANGDYMLFLNSGDMLANDYVLDEIATLHIVDDIIYGDCIFIKDKKERLGIYPKNLTFSFFLESSLPHPATFIRRDIFDVVGYYDEQMKIVSDWKFFMDAIFKYKCSYKKIDLTISVFFEDGVSSGSANQKLIQEERYNVITKHYYDFLKAELKKADEFITHVKMSRIISFLKKLGFLSNINLN